MSTVSSISKKSALQRTSVVVGEYAVVALPVKHFADVGNGYGMNIWPYISWNFSSDLFALTRLSQRAFQTRFVFTSATRNKTLHESFHCGVVMSHAVTPSGTQFETSVWAKMSSTHTGLVQSRFQQSWLCIFRFVLT